MDLAKLDFGLLLTLDALLRDRNVTHAAARVGISQPALSARLGRLREVFADPLFVPATSGRGVVPTPRASALQIHLAAVLSHAAWLAEPPEAFNPALTRRTFVVAMSENPGAVLAPALFSGIAAEAPSARIVLLEPGPDILHKLEQGDVDLLVAGPEKAVADLMQRPLLDDRFLSAQRLNHPRGRRPIDLDEFCALDHLLISSDGGGFHGLVDNALTAIGRTRRVTMSIQNYALAPMILSSSDCICTMPRRFLERFANQLDLFAPPLDLPTIRLLAFWHARNHGDQAHAWLREKLSNVAGRLREGQSSDGLSSPLG